MSEVPCSEAGIKKVYRAFFMTFFINVEKG